MSGKVLVIGAGLSGCVAALAARRAGAEVLVVSGPGGATATWSGRLDVFGPVGELREEALPWFGPGANAGAGAPARIGRAERLEALLRRRPWHPYRRLGLEDAEALAAAAGEALSLLDEAADGAPRLCSPCWMGTAAGTAQVGDGGAPTAAPGGRELRERPLLWLDVPGASRYPAEVAGAMLAWQLGRAAQDLRVIPVAEEAAFAISPHQQPVALSRRLDAGPDGEAGQALLRAVAAALEGAPKDGVALLPPVLGQRAAAAAAWRAALEAATGRPVVELLGVEDSAHGFRLWRTLGEALAATEGIEVAKGPLKGLTLEARAGHAHAATLGLAQPRRVEGLRGVVLATGSFLGGGRRAVEPLREALLGLPLWLGGEVMDNLARPPVVFVEERPWSDHALWQLGVGIDARGRALGEDGRAAWENVYAAGRLVGGTNAALDGSAQGVDLITGLRAGQAAAGQERS